MSAIPVFWPQGSTFFGVRFAPSAEGYKPLFELPPPISRHAIVTEPSPDSELQMRIIPSGDGEDLTDQISQWVAPASESDGVLQIVTLQGAHIYWRLPRVAIVAAPERVDSVRR